MEGVIGSLLTVLLDGGRPMVAFLMLVVVMLVLDRSRMVRNIERREERIDAILDQYHKGNLTLVDALNSIKLLLYEIRTKL